MKKDLKNKTALFPMPVLMVAAYDENGVVNVMNAAWGMISDRGQNHAVLRRKSQDDEKHPRRQGLHRQPRRSIAHGRGRFLRHGQR